MTTTIHDWQHPEDLAELLDVFGEQVTESCDAGTLLEGHTIEKQQLKGSDAIKHRVNHFYRVRPEPEAKPEPAKEPAKPNGVDQVDDDGGAFGWMSSRDLAEKIGARSYTEVNAAFSKQQRCRGYEIWRRDVTAEDKKRLGLGWRVKFLYAAEPAPIRKAAAKPKPKSKQPSAAQAELEQLRAKHEALLGDFADLQGDYLIATNDLEMLHEKHRELWDEHEKLRKSAQSTALVVAEPEPVPMMTIGGRTERSPELEALLDACQALAVDGGSEQLRTQTIALFAYLRSER